MDIALGVILSLATVVIAYFAFQQYRIGREQFRLGLFDRRYAIFEEVMSVLADVYASGGASKKALADIKQARAVGFFVLSSETNAYLEQLEQKLKTLFNKDKEMEAAPIGGRTDKLAEEVEALLTDATLRFDTARDKFAVHLRIDAER
jgi:hypothetical protein